MNSAKWIAAVARNSIYHVNNASRRSRRLGAPNLMRIGGVPERKPARRRLTR
jgi:hypothetical protein